MVGRPERAVLDERRVGGELVEDGINAGYVEGFIDGHAGHDSRQRPGQQGFPSARRSVHQHVMIPGCCNLESPFDMLLPLDFPEICLCHLNRKFFEGFGFERNDGFHSNQML